VKIDDSFNSGRHSKKTRERLSELEGCVLGLVWLLGPCTPYVVRKTFVQSPSSQWSGSAGAIYPLVRRLERRGLLQSKPSATGSRKSHHYELTAEGRQRLTDWLGPPFNENVTGILPDPIRTRLAFLEALPRSRRHSFLSIVEKVLRRQIDKTKHECQENRRKEDLLDYLISRGALITAEARLTWIREVRAALEGVSDKK
jgi:DNA-binding PadR family transcriptional regulator